MNIKNSDDIIFLCILGAFLVFPSTSIRTHAEEKSPVGSLAEVNEPEKKATEKWKKNYKVRQRNLTQRERRTGRVLDDRWDTAGSDTSQRYKRSEDKLTKKGFWPFKKGNSESEPQVGKHEHPTGMAQETENTSQKIKGKNQTKSKNATSTADKNEGDASGEERINPIRKTDQNYARGKYQFEKEDYERAIKYFEAFLESSTFANRSLVPPALYFIAKSREKLEQFNVANDAFKKVINIKKSKTRTSGQDFWIKLAEYDLSVLKKSMPDRSSLPKKE